MAGNNFDRGLHLHPDERWLMMVEERINLFDRLDPDFYAYGTLPLYILKAVGQLHDHFFLTKMNNYDGLLYLGRYLTSGLDILMIGLVGLITWRLTERKHLSLLAGLGYGLMFFPIQNSNFFTVDIFVSVSVSTILLGVLSYLKTKKSIWLLVTFVAMGTALATKVTPIIIIAPALVYLILLPLLIPDKKKLSRKVVTAIITAVIGTALTASVFGLTMPFALIKPHQVIKEVTTQLEMNTDAYIFPYTLQYVGTPPYFYYLENMAIYGTGPILFGLAVAGLIVTSWQILASKGQRKLWQWLRDLATRPIVVYLGFNLIYFIVIGRSAVKFMRYGLPLYPALAILAGLGLAWILSWKKLNWNLRRYLVITLLALASWWTIGFMQIYQKPHTRITASEWMRQNIPAGSMVAVEHWDDRMPLYGSEIYQYVELPLYELPDDNQKWQLVNSYLAQADYIVIASNRLSTPLPKLADCDRWKKCYPLTAQYYHQLFAGKMEFKEVARFNNFPRFWTPFGSYELNDQTADESFTVYDHPEVIIFKKDIVEK